MNGIKQSRIALELLNRVDIASEVYPAALGDIALKHKTQTLLINEIKNFEEKCLLNLSSKYLKYDLTNSISESISSIEEALNLIDTTFNENQIVQLNKEITRVFARIKNATLNSHSLIFLKHDSEFLKRCNFEIRFCGVLFVIEDNFIEDALFDSVNRINEEDSCTEFGNERMKINLLKTYIQSLHTIDNLINYVTIDSHKIKTLDFRGVHFSDPLFWKFHSLDLNIFSSLRSLTNIEFKKVKIKKIHPDIFQEMTNLKILDFNKNQLDNFDHRLLRNLSSLEFLGIRGNEITEFDSRTFQGLINLKSIELSKNKLKKLNEKTFQGLKNLRIIYLSANRLTKLDTNLFQGLENLNSVHIDNNELSYVSPEVFKGVKSLHTIGLSGSKLTDQNYRNIKRQLGAAVYDSD